MAGAVHLNWRSRSNSRMKVMAPQDHLILGHLVHSTIDGGQPAALLRDPNVCNAALAEEALAGVFPPVARLSSGPAEVNSDGLFLLGGVVWVGNASASSCSVLMTGSVTTVMAAPCSVWMIASSGICFDALRGFSLYSTSVLSHDHGWRADVVSAIALVASWKRRNDDLRVAP